MKKKKLIKTDDYYISGTEICEELEISSSRLSVWKKKLKITELPGNTLEKWYTKNDWQKFLAYYELQEIKRKKAEERKRNERLPGNLKELQKAHPLVTNPKCFVESWFPEN